MKTKIFIEKVLGFLNFGYCYNCINSVNLIAKIQLKLLNERVLSTGKPCTSAYVSLLQPFHRGILSIHYYTAQKF